MISILWERIASGPDSPHCISTFARLPRTRRLVNNRIQADPYNEADRR